ncbi:MAG: dicarboxylate/amino acid:cation symporter [Lachnospiraceae bacterium]|nr:dicarboxylate/amino acid:cation symporter [Candidatus Minthocola equi]
MDKKAVTKNYIFLGIMILAMILGAVFGAIWPGAASAIKPLGQIFINMMFCIVVPLVFASIAGAIANTKRERSGKILGVTIVVFIVTGAIAAFVMFALLKIFPPEISSAIVESTTEESFEYASIGELITNFFTSSDFVGLLSRKAMLPLIVFSVLFGFAVNANGGIDTPVGKFLEDLSNVMLKVVQIVTYYAPIAFFAIFANLMADYGTDIFASGGQAILLYYVLCFVYIFTAFPFFARFGGGEGAIMVMLKHITRPAVVSLGTCSSVATIPTNLDAAKATGISDDVAEIVIPFGATTHMDGSCFSCVLKIAFLMTVFGQDMSWDKLPVILLVAVLSSVGMSGVPGGGYIGEFIICSLFFADKMDIAFPILVAIGNIVDPPATMINASGDYVVSFIVSRFIDGKDWLQKQLNPDKQ